MGETMNKRPTFEKKEYLCIIYPSLKRDEEILLSFFAGVLIQRFTSIKPIIC